MVKVLKGKKERLFFDGRGSKGDVKLRSKGVSTQTDGKTGRSIFHMQDDDVRGEEHKRAQSMLMGRRDSA